MEKNPVIRFESRERILESARKYVDSVDAFSKRAENGIPLLLKALKYAAADFKHEILLFLVSFAKDEVVWPLVDMMADTSETAELRHDAAAYLSVIGPLLTDSQPLVDRLLNDIESADPERRLNATIALGWDGNSNAAIPLIQTLYDADARVQQAAVNALCNLRDDRILHVLTDRLNQGSSEQKRVILLNLWRFDSKAKQVAEIYLHYLKDEDPDIRFDALVWMGLITETRDQVEAYRTSLSDKESRIRELALDRLTDAGDSVLESLRPEIQKLLEDPDMKIKSAGLRIIKKTNR